MGNTPESLGLDVTVDRETGCWLWRGRLDDGYGSVRSGGHKIQAHRWVWIQVNGEIPPRVQLDHMCRERSCVRPEHMDPVTGSENVRRTFSRHRRSLEFCPDGHDLSQSGIMTKNGGVVCRLCCNL